MPVSRRGSMVPSVCAAASRSSSATATRSSSASATARLLCSGRSARDPSAARIDTRLVSVPKPEPGSATSFATSRSTPLRRSLSAARSSEPVSAANPTRTGTGCSGSRVAAPSLSRPWAIRATSARRSGVDSSSERQVVGARELGLGGGDRPEVGHGRGHDQGVEAGGGGWTLGRGAAARRAARRSSRPGRPWPRAADRPRRSRRRPSPARRGRARPRRSPTPIRPVERLPMKRTGSIASRVPPAVTTTWRPARSASRAGPTRGGRAAGSGARTADAATAATTASTIAPSSASRPIPSWPDASGPRSGLDDRVAEGPQPRDVGDASPDGATCRRPWPVRRRPAPTSRDRSR